MIETIIIRPSTDENQNVFKSFGDVEKKEIRFYFHESVFAIMKNLLLSYMMLVPVLNMYLSKIGIIIDLDINENNIHITIKLPKEWNL